MRASHLCRAAAILGALALCVSAADAGKKKKKKKKKTDDEIVDISGFKDKMVVYTDGDGGFFAAVWNDTDTLFYGDGKTMWKQRVTSAFRDGTKWEMRMWAPRVNGVADIIATDATGKMVCGDDEFELTKVADADARKILDKATFKGVFWKRQGHRLSRDDRGTYYYVDRLRDEFGGKGYRLFAGQKGAMKELPLINIVSDSVGEIFASKKGELRYVQEKTTASWYRGEKKTELTTVPVEDNLTVIYTDLGIYDGSLGTPCDEY